MDRDRTRAEARLSSRSLGWSVEDTAVGVGPRAWSVSQPVPADLGYRRPCDLLRVTIYHRWPRGREFSPRDRGRRRRVRARPLSVGRAAVHAVARWARALRVRQPLLGIPVARRE